MASVDPLDCMEARLNSLLAGGTSLTTVGPPSSSSSVQGKGPQPSAGYKKARLPPFPFFLQLKNFSHDGQFPFATWIDEDAWTLHTFAMSWLKQEVAEGKVKRLEDKDLQFGVHVLARKGERLIRGMVTKPTDDKKIVIIDTDEAEEFYQDGSLEVFELPKETFNVAMRAVMIQIDKTQLFNGTGLVFRAFQETGLKDSVFRATEAISCGPSGEQQFTLDLWTPQRDNLGEMILKKINEICAVPLPQPKYMMPVNVTHLTSNGQFFYQAIMHQSKVLAIIQNFDILIRREIPTIKAILPNYSDIGTVKKRLAIKNHIFAAPYELDGRYYRSHIVDVMSDEEVTVHFIDYGNNEKVNIKDLIILDEFDIGIKAIPPMARMVKVHGIDSFGDEMDDVIDTYSDIRIQMVSSRDGYPTVELFINMVTTPGKEELVTLQEAIKKLPK